MRIVLIASKGGFLGMGAGNCPQLLRGENASHMPAQMTPPIDPPSAQQLFRRDVDAFKCLYFSFCIFTKSSQGFPSLRFRWCARGTSYGRGNT